MLQTLTPRLANESNDSERLECLGDALLKLVVTVELFRLYPQRHEGFLTIARSLIVSNQNLHHVSQKLGLSKYLRACRLSTGKQLLCVRPAGMSFNAFRKGLSLWNQKTTLFSRQLMISDNRQQFYKDCLQNKKRRFYKYFSLSLYYYYYYYYYYS